MPVRMLVKKPPLLGYSIPSARSVASLVHPGSLTFNRRRHPLTQAQSARWGMVVVGARHQYLDHTDIDAETGRRSLQASLNLSWKRRGEIRTREEVWCVDLYLN